MSCINLSDIRIEMFPALEGDSFLVSLGTDHKTHILIDGGFESTYYEFLKPRLTDMSNKGEYLTLVIVTHIDADHIEGIVELFKENNSAQNPKVIRIDEVWHNSYKHLQTDKKIDVELDWREKSILADIIASGSIKSKENTNENKNISAEQGSTLAALLHNGKYNWNKEFEERAVNCQTKNLVYLHKDISLRLLSPNSEKLDKLAKYWLKELKKQKYNFRLTDDKIFDDAYEFFLLKQKELENLEQSKDVSYGIVNIESLLSKKMTYDTSPANGSSISFILEYKGKKLLFLGGSHSQLIYEEIQKLVDNNGYNPSFELIKVSHHGSHRNTSKDLLEIIDSSIFLFSTNGGKNNHPNMETVARIVSRRTERERKLVFNYPPVGELLYDDDIKKKLNFEIIYSTGEKSTVIDL
jgi:beta-lactamase superfamily II metal-dependent hydrolase